MAVMQGFEGYGGATITRRIDGAGAEWIGMCAKRDGVFGFYVFKNGANVPIAPFCSGRGSISRDGHWIAWDDNAYFTGALPGWAPVASGYTVAPNASIRIFVDQDGFDGTLAIPLASYGIPPCTGINVRLAIDAVAGHIFRCGPQIADQNLQAASMLTATGLGVDKRAYESGVISVMPNRTLLVMTETGPIAKGWIDVTGWWA